MDRPTVPGQLPAAPPPYNVSGAPGENRTGYGPAAYREAQLANIPTGAMPLQQPPTEQQPTLPPQTQDIKFFEENAQLPTGQAPLTKEDQLKVDEQAVVDAKAAILTDGTIENKAYDALIAQGLTPEDALKSILNRVGDPNYKGILASLLNVVDLPRQEVVGKMGDSAYDVATQKSKSWDPGWAAAAPGNWMIPGLDGTRFNQDFATWANDPKNWQAIRNAYENGFQATGTDPQ